MTASECHSVETHSDATVCSGLYTKTPKWSTKMHASKLLKGVLMSRTLNSTSSDQESSSASSPNTAPARGKRAFSSDNAITSASVIPKKTSSSPIKTTCLCAPTKHAGSFRCRLHRVTQKHWDGRQAHPTSTSKASSSTSLSANENSGKVGAITPWANGLQVPGTGCISRAGSARPSRLRMVVVAAQAEDMSSPDVDDPASSMLSEDSVKYIRVATTTTTQEVTVKENGAPGASRMLHTTS